MTTDSLLPSSWEPYSFSDFGADGQPVVDGDDDEHLIRSYPDVALVLGDRTELGVGTLFVTSRYVVSFSLI